MSAKLFRIESTVTLFYVSEDGKEPDWITAARAAADEVRDNPLNVAVDVRHVTRAVDITSELDWIDTLPRGTKDQRTIRERLDECGVRP